MAIVLCVGTPTSKISPRSREDIPLPIFLTLVRKEKSSAEGYFQKFQPGEVRGSKILEKNTQTKEVGNGG